MATLLAASQVFPTTSFSSDDRVQYRPAKNIEAFNSLLPPAVEFVEGSSSGTLAVAEGKYEPINDSPKQPRMPTESQLKHMNGRPISPTAVRETAPREAPTPKITSQLYTRAIDTTWPQNATMGAGFFNTGNTCFLNSALQCLLHTPPLLRLLVEHSNLDPCRISIGNFCMSCSLRKLMIESFKRNKPFTPWHITNNIHNIAKHMRKGRQEDSHEFLRYAIDSLQKSCLSGLPPKLDHKIAETTWVHKLFGGRLRSRVTCMLCGHHSDTFDSILDLSIDIHGQASLKDALRKFTAVDHLKGADKYKCEKCKKPVNAEKRFTVHEAPIVLTVHLKRFTPMGRKLAHAIRYDEHLTLQSCMSDGQYGPSYSLYAVISHAGGGPNSGHYYAHVRDSRGVWYEMNDEMVSRTSIPVGMKNAYILFYMKDKGQILEAALNSSKTVEQQHNVLHKKRKVILSDDEKEEFSEPVNGSTFIGPQLPTPRPSPVHPQTESLQRKIMTIERKKAVPAVINRVPLVDYPDEDEEEGEVVQRPIVTAEDTNASSPAVPPPSSPLPPSSSPGEPIDSISFYGREPAVSDNDGAKKRKTRESEDNNGSRDTLSSISSPKTQTELGSSASSKSNSLSHAVRNPFSSITGGHNFNGKREELVFRPRRLQKQYGGKARQKMLF